MSDTKWTPGPWLAFNMTNADTGERMTPDEIGEYVANAIRVNAECTDFLFVSADKPDGSADICHVGNGPDRAANAHLIAAAPEFAESAEYNEQVLFPWLSAALDDPKACNAFKSAIRTAMEMNAAVLAKARGESDE